MSTRPKRYFAVLLALTAGMMALLMFPSAALADPKGAQADLRRSLAEGQARYRSLPLRRIMEPLLLKLRSTSTARYRTRLTRFPEPWI